MEDLQKIKEFFSKPLNEATFKVGDKVTYLGHPGEITGINKEMTGAITYNVAYDKGNGRTKATNIHLKSGAIKLAEAEEKYTVAGHSVTLNKGTKSDGTDWTVTFKNGKSKPLVDVLALIKPMPKGITMNEAKEETGVDMAKKQLDALGVKYEMSKTDKVRPFKVIYKPINKSDEFYDKFEDIVDLFNLKGFVKSSIKENNSIDYTKLISLIKSANNPRNLPIYYNSDNGVVNIGGVGYDKGELVKMFNSQPGQSLDIKNLFYKANQNPEETKNAIESMDPSIKVEIGYGYGNEPFVKYIKSINEANGFTSGKQMINIKLKNYPKAVAKVNQLIDMIGESNFTMEMAEWIFDFFNNASFEQPVNEATKEYDPDQAQLDDEDEIFMPYDDKGRPLEEAYVPSNIKDFAKRKGISSLVNKVAGWAEKVGKRITGGTAIGYNYSTLILDMEYQGSEIRINTDNDTVTLYDEPVYSFNDFKQVYLDNQDIEENVAPNHDGKAAPYGSGYKPLEEKIAEALDKINEELCPAGKAYIKRRQAAGEKSSAYLSGRGVKVCKGQMSGKAKKKK